MNHAIAIANRQRLLKPDRSRLSRTLSAILHERERAGWLSVALVNDREIRRVHREFLGDDTPTDVISFAYNDGDPVGELVISAETALREARKRRLDPQEELLRYAIHGLLHVLGHDDRTVAGRRRMQALERRYLKVFSTGSRARRTGMTSP